MAVPELSHPPSVSQPLDSAVVTDSKEKTKKRKKKKKVESNNKILLLTRSLLKLE